MVDRTDIVRIFVDIPEQDANYVHDRHQGDRARPGVPRRADPGQVTRTSWALNVKSRTLRAEIDLPNPGSQLLPGMYAYGKVIIERPGVRALPVAALDLQRRQDLLLDVRERPRGADRGPDGRQRRRVDRGHQSPAPAGVRASSDDLDADRRHGAGDPRRPVDPRRRRPGEGRPGGGEAKVASATLDPRF